MRRTGNLAQKRGLVAALVVCALTILAGPASAQETTRSANAFNKSFCVNVHSNYEGTPYYDYDRAAAALARFGPNVTVRDGYHGRTDQEQFHQIAFYEYGAQSVLVMDPRADRPLATLMEHIDDGAIPGLRILEGPNEYNTVAAFREYDGSPPRQWAINLQEFMRDLVQQRDTLGLEAPVADWSPTTWQSAYEARDAATVDDSDLDSNPETKPDVDLGNIHWYSSAANVAPGFQNTDTQWQSGIDWSRNAMVFDVHGPGFPWIVTEIGYHTSLTDPGPDVEPLHGHHGVPEDVQSTYTVNTLLEAFWYQAHHNPAPLTCLYEMFDASCPNCGGPDHHQNQFGLLRADYTAKPAVGHIRNLRAALARSGSRDTPVSFSYDLTGPNGEPGWQHFRYFSLRRGDGRQVVAIWRPDTIWDRQTYQRINVAAKTVTVTIPGGVQDVDIIQPAPSANPARTCRASGGSVTTGVSAYTPTLVVVGARRKRDPGAC